MKNVKMSKSLKLFFKSAFLSGVAILLIIIGFFAAGYLFGSPNMY